MGKKYAVICLDETGSMTGQEERVATSLNEYISQLPKKCHVTVFKFGGERWTTHYDGMKADWNAMTREHYRPDDMTPLYDAVAKTIKHAKKISEKGDKVLVMIDTDGHENQSKEHTHESIKNLVDQCRQDGWEFLFMASGLDQARASNIGRTGVTLGMTVNARSYDDRLMNYAAASAQTTSYFNGSSTAKNVVEDEDEDTLQVQHLTGAAAK